MAFISIFESLVLRSPYPVKLEFPMGTRCYQSIFTSSQIAGRYDIDWEQ